MKSSLIALLFGLFIVGALVSNAFFVVNQTEQALVLRFGKPVNIIREPGLKFKVPMIDAVEKFDRRTLVFNAEPMTVILRDQDRLIVDAFVAYRITDPLKFYQAVRSERIMNMRLESILEKSLRDILGREDLNTLLSPKRAGIMGNIRDMVFDLASGERELKEEPVTTEKTPTNAPSIATPRAGFGIEVEDVRIMRTDLPKETSDPIYNRMRSDRQKVAEKFRAEGQKESQIIRSEAEKERTITLAEAEKRASTIRGEGDGTASKIFAEAFGQDKEFYAFYRTMQAYRKTINKDDTTVILSPNSEFLKFMDKGK